MHRFLVAAAVALAGLVAPAAAAACTVPDDATQVLGGGGLVYRSEGRLFGCTYGRPVMLRRTAGVRRVTANGYAAGWLVGRGRCSRAEAVDLSDGHRVSVGRAGCGGPVQRLRVSPDGILVVQQGAAAGGAIVEIDGQHRRILEADSRARPLSVSSLGLATWHEETRVRSVLLGHTGCAPGRAAYGRIEAGDVRAWTVTAYDGDDAGVVLVCDRRVGVAFVADVFFDTACGQADAISLRPPFVAVQHLRAFSHCVDDRHYDVRVVDVDSGFATTDTAYLDGQPRRAQITPAGGLVLLDSPYEGPPTPEASKRIRYVSRGPTTALDDSAAIDPDSLVLNGDVASWTTDGQPRNARVP